MTDLQPVYIEPAFATSLLQEMGYRGKLHDRNGTPAIESASNGMKFYVNFFKVDESESKGSYAAVQFDAGVYLSPDVDLNWMTSLCNDFNRQYRFAKAFLGGQEQKYLGLQMDVAVRSEPKQWFESSVSIFLNLMTCLAEDIIDTDVFRGDGCTQLHTEAVRLIWDIVPDPKRAVELYRKAAVRGYAGSQNNLGDLYEKGAVVPQSHIFAAYWYARAAERGEPTAYLSLATLFSDHPADQDMLVEAAKFAILAIEGLPSGLNKSTAKSCLERLCELLSEDELKTANTRANLWRPLYQERRLMSDTPEARLSGSSVSETYH